MRTVSADNNLLGPGTVRHAVHRGTGGGTRSRSRSAIHSRGSAVGSRATGSRSATATHVRRNIGAATGLLRATLLPVRAKVQTSHVQLISHD